MLRCLLLVSVKTSIRLARQLYAASYDVPALLARYEQAEPYQHRQGTHPTVVIEHRVGVSNIGETTVNGVRITLVRLDPRPRHMLEGYPPYVPYILPPIGHGDGAAGVSLPCGQEEFWRLGFTSTGSDNSMDAGGWAVPDQTWRGSPWTADADERWRFSYRITAEQSSTATFSIVVAPRAGHLSCTLEG